MYSSKTLIAAQLAALMLVAPSTVAAENPFEVLPSEAVSIERSNVSDCAHCEAVSLTNGGTGDTVVRVRIDPFPETAPNDRSLGSWIYTYQRQLVRIDGGVVPTNDATPVALTGIASQRRFELRALHLDGEPVSYTPGQWSIDIPISGGANRNLLLYAGPARVDAIPEPVADFHYWQLWWPLAALCRAVERFMIAALPWLSSSGVVLLIVAVVRLLTFPINRWSIRSQNAFEAVQTKIAPEVADIKTRLRGGDQSEAILALYQANGMNPLSGLKGSVGLLVQIPILIAMFNVASDSAALSGQPMLWVDDAAQPEHSFAWGADIPLLGGYFNLIALALAAFLIGSEVFKKPRSTGSLIFAIVVGLLLYSFPAFLVTYWFLISIAQKIEQVLASSGGD
ncbi:MAG: YidC/Oxa1 family membrane protein insertase [Pseudomonadota bacterium]